MNRYKSGEASTAASFQRLNRQGQGEEVQILKHWPSCIAAGTSQPCLQCLRFPGTSSLWLVDQP